MGKGFSLSIDMAAANALAGMVALREVTDTTRQVLNRATVLTPVRHGRLRAGNQMRVSQRGPIVVGEVYNQTSYAAAVHDGSRAHVVRPRRKKVLRFTVAGKTVFAQAVTIPARKGRPWLYRALVEVAAPRGYTITRV